jgi:protein-disulfide isomerase
VTTKSIQSLGVIALLSPMLCAVMFAQVGETPSDSSNVLVEVDGVKLTLADFESKRPSGLFQARNSFYQAERKAVDDFVDQYLLERQAKKEHLTVSELLKVHVDDTIGKDPSEESLRVYYEGVDTNQPFEAVRDQILQHLRERRIAKAKGAYMQSLRSQSAISLRLVPPRGSVDMKSAELRGSPSAPVTVVEFADFECPYCQQMQPVLDKIESNFKGKIIFAYKDVPLPMHPHAQKAAEAAHCAGLQGKYWEYHDLLYKTKQLEISALKDDAQLLQLDIKSFDKCVDSGEQADVIKAQFAEGQALGLQGTPSFLVNGRFFSGGFTYEQFAAIIEEELHQEVSPTTTTAANR